MLAFRMLDGFAGARSRRYLSTLAKNLEAEDIVRFGARRRVGWTQRGERKARLAFLASLKDEVSTLVEALHQATVGHPFPPDGEILQEVLGYLMAMPSQRVEETVTLAVNELGSHLSWLLRALLHASDASVHHLALQQIVSLGDRGAEGALRRAASTANDSRFRSEIETVLRRWQIRLVSTERAVTGAQLPPLHSAYLSAIDGDGGQVAIVVRERSPEVYELAQLFFKDSWGIKDSFGISETTWEEVQRLYGTTEQNRLSEFGGHADEEGVPLVEVDLAAVRKAIVEAVQLNSATSHPLPPAFEIWEPLLHDQDPPAAGEPVATVELDDAPYGDRTDLLQRSGQLLRHRYFTAWFFNPDEIEPALEGVPRPREGRMTQKQFRPLIERLVDRKTLQLMRGRLRRQAWLLKQAGDLERSDVALAVAASLATAKGPQMGDHPFLKSMVLHSLANLFGHLFHGE